LAAAEAHPDYAALSKRKPSTGGQTAWMGCLVAFGLLFTAVAVFMLLAPGGPSGRSRAASPPPLFQLVASLFVLIGVVVVIWTIVRWVRFKAAPLEVLPALVLDKRQEVWGGGDQSSASTTYYVTLETKTGDRREVTIKGRLYGQVTQDDVGVAYIKTNSLLDFRRLPV